MARLLALEWNATEARLAVVGSAGHRGKGGAGGGEAVVVEHAFTVDLRSDEPGEDQPAVDAGPRIAAALAARHLGRLDTLVAIGRTNIELRKLSLPPVPDAELPDMVRLQAVREFNALEADWPLDFIPIDEAPDRAPSEGLLVKTPGEGRAPAEGGSRGVLAAAIDPELVEQVRQTCHGAGLKAHRLILRPCAAASLLCRSAGERLRRVTLLVDLLVDEADLTVVCDRQVVFLRTVRLPGDPLTDEGMSQALLGEIRRTVAAVQNQLGGRPVESIALCGSGELHAALAASIRGQFGTPTELFDPFAGLTLSTALGRALPDHPGRFAPLLGALLDEVDEVQHAIDFLHPRRAPPPPSRRKLYASIGSAVAVLAAVLVFSGFVYKNQLNAEIEQLTNRSEELDKEVGQAGKIQGAASEIGKWSGSDLCWLDELRWLSDKFPPAKDAMLTELQMRSSQGKVLGKMEIKGLAQDVKAIDEGEQSLRDDRHEVIGNEATEEQSQKSYGWRFSSSLYLKQAAVSKPAASSRPSAVSGGE